jgi:L-alanine-DL-glutamate epimerase-like enolase superfamily enzyme
VKIKSIRATPFAIPLRRVLHLATGPRSTLENVIVEVETDDGVVGVAESVPFAPADGETVATVMSVVTDVLAPMLPGASLLRLEQLHAKLATIGASNTAKGSVSLAAYDALGKSLGLSCSELLGGYASAVPCAAILPVGPIAEIVEEATRLREKYGITTFKLKVGNAVADDIARVREVRRQLGDDVVLRVDANQLFAGPDAMTFLRATESCGLASFEEPCHSREAVWRERVAAAASIPVIGDESCAELAHAAREVGSGRSTGVAIKLTRSGIATATRIRDFCEGAGVPVVVGNRGDSAVGTAASVAFAAAAPSTATSPIEGMYFLELEDNLGPVPTIVNGMISVMEGPGFGFDLDRAALRRYATRP